MIKGTNISLRALEPTDIDHLYNWENDTGSWKVSNTLTPYSRHILEQYILNSHQDIFTAKQLRLVICPNSATNKPIGCIDLFDFDPMHKRAGIGILVAEKNERGKGYASESLKLLINYAKETLNIHQLYCNISISNEPSVLLFKKNGFDITGVKKAWIKNGDNWEDEFFMQLIIGK